MTTVLEQQDVYLSHFTQWERELAGDGGPQIARLRQEAIHRFAEMGFPTSRAEEWKYTNVAPVGKIRFQPARPGLRAEQLARIPGADLGGSRLVFVNGRWSPKLSTLEELAPEVNLSSLAAVLENGSAVVEEHLARYAAWQNHAFVALNTAFIHDGAVVEIPKSLVLEKPIHLLYVTTAGTPAAVAHPRTLVVVGPGAQAKIIETYLGLGAGVYFNNAVTEIITGENAVLDHYRFQGENDKAFHIATLQVHQSRNSTFTSHNLCLGGALVRNDINAVLAGEGVSCTLNGLYVARQRQHVDNHTLIDHACPHGSSRELYKGILDGHATGVFNGTIMVRKDAQKTDSVQNNRNLLLSADALINTKPQLEIYADDVKCTHGATIGQLDKEALFYLHTRGIEQEQARSLLIYAFASEIINGFKVESLQSALHALLSGYLSTPATPQEAL